MLNHRPLWNEKLERDKLGDVAYDWFVERAEKQLPNCPTCGGAGEVALPDTLRKQANMAGHPFSALVMETPEVLEPCPLCLEYVKRLSNFSKQFHDTVPRRFRELSLSTLKPYGNSPVNDAAQIKIIEKLRKNPNKGYAFFGPPGTSKTTWATLLYVKVLWKYIMDDGGSNVFPVYRISTKEMLDQHTDWTRFKNEPDDEFKEVVLEPKVSRVKIEKVSRSGKDPSGKVRIFHLFLEEIDKIRETESRRANLFEILNSLYDNVGQLVVTSNLRIEEFKEVVGKDLYRRIEELCEIIDLHPPKKEEKQTRLQSEK